jgi:hypothetical protein
VSLGRRRYRDTEAVIEHCLFLSHTLSLCLSLTHTHALSHAHTHTHKHTHGFPKIKVLKRKNVQKCMVFEADFGKRVHFGPNKTDKIDKMSAKVRVDKDS